MAQKRIVWSKTARADFKATLLFYKERNGNSTYSKRLANEITTLIELLPKNNFLGKVTTVSGVRVIVRK
ncbi:MAG: type II toxin-antitoxin system RelE/ParE family toxin, partial [Rufibacter sp.]